MKPGFLLSPMACLDGKGQQFDGASGAIIEDLQFQYLFVRDKQDLKRTDLVFEGYLYGDLEEVTVPFEIKNIALPETVTK